MKANRILLMSLVVGVGLGAQKEITAIRNKTTKSRAFVVEGM
jgi:hypothetical protein